MNCLFHEFEVVDDNGDVHLDTLFHSVPHSIRDKLIGMSEHCTHPVGDNLCDKAWWFHQCWKKADPQVSGRVPLPLGFFNIYLLYTSHTLALFSAVNLRLRLTTLSLSAYLFFYFLVQDPILNIYYN